MEHAIAAENLWDELRATRWRPPTAAAQDPDRRLTYVSALEQAEQLFRAAAAVGAATRPLLIFYGLSQAGRAIAAAASRLKGNTWNLTGHGMASDGLDGTLTAINVTTGKPGTQGSFVRLSEVLGSPVWGQSAALSLNELWDVIPENRSAPLADTGEARRTPLYVEPIDLGEPHPLAVAAVIYFPPWVTAALDGVQALRTYLGSYPGAQGFDSYVNTGAPGSEPVFHGHLDGWAELQMNWLLPAGSGDHDDRVAFFRSRTRSYCDRLCFFPAVGNCAQSMHPLMAWWAVLHALSMLARYQPAQWGIHIDIDASPHAGAVEKFLKQALLTVPALIAETITYVS